MAVVVVWDFAVVDVVDDVVDDVVVVDDFWAVVEVVVDPGTAVVGGDVVLGDSRLDEVVVEDDDVVDDDVVVSMVCWLRGCSDS